MSSEERIAVGNLRVPRIVPRRVHDRLAVVKEDDAVGSQQSYDAHNRQVVLELEPASAAPDVVDHVRREARVEQVLVGQRVVDEVRRSSVGGVKLVSAVRRRTSSPERNRK